MMSDLNHNHKRWQTQQGWVLLMGIAAFGLPAQAPAWLLSERGVLEVSQAGLLALSMLLFCRAMLHRPLERTDKTLLAALALWSLGMLLREVDVERIDILPTWMQTLGHGSGRIAVLASLSLPIILAFYRHAQHYRRQWPTLRQSVLIQHLCSALIFLLIAQVYEELARPLAEECLELLAYLLLCYGAWHSRSSVLAIKPHRTALECS